MHADLGTHSAHCPGDRGDLTGTVLGWLSTRLLLCNDRCPGWVAQNCGVSAVAVLVGVVQFLDMVVVPVFATTVGCAMLGSTIDICYASSRWLLEVFFFDFLHEGLSRLLRSTLRPGRHIVDNGSGMFHAGFAGIDFALCSHDCRQSWKSVHFSTSHLYFQHVQRSNFLRESIFWSPRSLTGVCSTAGGAGVAGSLDSQATRYRYCTNDPRRL